LIAVGTLPVYTRYLSPADYGAAETLLTGVILLSIFVRLGVGEAFVRFYYDDDDPARRVRIARLAVGFVVLVTTTCALPAAILAGPLSRLVLGFEDPILMRIAVLGLWTFTNLEVAYALLRVDERVRAYLTASVINVLLTVTLTVVLVVVAHQRARGLLAGNFVASTVVLVGLWIALRDRVGLRWRRADLVPMLRFGLPMVPADASVYALNVIDRAYLYRAHSHASAGLYALAVKVATVVTLTVRGFQYAWPPLAYSITDDAQAARLYARVATYYALVTGFTVAAVTLLGRWAIHLLAAHRFYGAYAALPWLALGWALYGLFVVLVVVAGRARVTTRNLVAALSGLAVNVGLLVALVDPLGISGAGIALCGAYLVMLAVMQLLTRRLFPVSFEWARLGQLVAVLATVSVAGELLLPASGAVGFLLRLGALAVIPLALAGLGFFSRSEVEQARALVGQIAARPRAQRPGAERPGAGPPGAGAPAQSPGPGEPPPARERL
ncbi:MAG TPA: lipopolysaccharide biosynthesis protein, partial [Solirubrobacteraceae bacterium]|nr:lipopolysaccharide biosynthesis protein [Solirubrobacteraceae bacterium]